MRDAAGIAVAVLFVLDLGRLDDEGLQQWRHDEHGGAFREAMTGVVGDPEASEFRPDQRSDLVMQAYRQPHRSEEHTSELQSLMRISYAVFCLKHKTKHRTTTQHIFSHRL